MAQTHTLSTDTVHYLWDTDNAPALTIASGDTVVTQTRDVSDDQITPRVRHERAGVDGAEPLLPARRADRGRGRRAGRHARHRDPRAEDPRLGLGRDPAGPRPAERGLQRALPEDLRPHHRRHDLAARGHRHPGRAVPGDDGRLPGGRQGAGDHAARPLRREPRHPPADGRHDAVPAGARARRAVLLRRRPRRPGRRRGLRHRHRVADGRDPPLHAREGPQHPGAAVPHRRRAHAAGRPRRLLRDDGHRARPVRRRAGGRAGDARPHRERLGPRPRATPTSWRARSST